MSKIWTGKFHYAWLIIIGCIGFYSIPVGLIGNTAGIFVAPVMAEYGCDQTSALMYRTIQPLVAALVVPFAGRILQKGNQRIILTIVALAFGLGTIWSAFATDLTVWNIYGVIYGITSGFFMYLAVPAIINIWFHKSAGLAIGIVATTLSILGAFMNTWGNTLILTYGWHTARLILCIISTVLSVMLSYGFLRKDPESMGLLPYGAGEENGEGKKQAVYGADLGTALRSPALYLTFIIAGFIVVAAAYFQQIPAYSTSTSLGSSAGAMAVSIVMIGGIVGKLLLGWLCDHCGSAIAGALGMVAGGIGMLVAFVAGGLGNVSAFYIGMAVFGIGYAALGVAVPMIVRDSFGTKNYSQIFSWVSTSIFLFTAVAFMVYGRIYDITGSYDGCFILVIALYAITAVLIPITIKLAHKTWSKE